MDHGGACTVETHQDGAHGVPLSVHIVDHVGLDPIMAAIRGRNPDETVSLLIRHFRSADEITELPESGVG